MLIFLHWKSSILAHAKPKFQGFVRKILIFCYFNSIAMSLKTRLVLFFARKNWEARYPHHLARLIFDQSFKTGMREKYARTIVAIFFLNQINREYSCEIVTYNTHTPNKLTQIVTPFFSSWKFDFYKTLELH